MKLTDPHGAPLPGTSRGPLAAGCRDKLHPRRSSGSTWPRSGPAGTLPGGRVRGGVMLCNEGRRDAFRCPGVLKVDKGEIGYCPRWDGAVTAPVTPCCSSRGGQRNRLLSVPP